MTRQQAIATVKAHPTDARAWLQLGEVLIAEGEQDDAARSFRRALRLDPTLRAASIALEKIEGREAAEPAFPLARLEEGEATEIGRPLSEDEWLNDMRERLDRDDEALPATRPARAPINKRRLLIVLLAVTASLISCYAVSTQALWRFQGSSARGGTPSQPRPDTPPLATRAVATVVPTWTVPAAVTPPSPTPRATATPRPAVTATLEPVASAEQAYRDFLEEVGAQFGTGIQKLTELSPAARAQPSLLSDEQWRMEMATSIALVQFASRQVIEYQPPERFALFHADYVRAAQLYDDAMRRYNSALTELNLGQLEEAEQLMAEANQVVITLSEDRLR